MTRDYTYIQNYTTLGQQVGSAGKALVLKPEFDPQNCVEQLHAPSVSALLQSDGRWRQRKSPESSWATSLEVAAQEKQQRSYINKDIQLLKVIF